MQHHIWYMSLTFFSGGKFKLQKNERTYKIFDNFSNKMHSSKLKEVTKGIYGYYLSAAIICDFMVPMMYLLHT